MKNEEVTRKYGKRSAQQPWLSNSGKAIRIKIYTKVEVVKMFQECGEYLEKNYIKLGVPTVAINKWLIDNKLIEI